MITINVTKAKAIAHDKRREARAEEFKPHDEVIMKQIPGVDATAAEAARAIIRTKYDTMQTAINSATTVDQIKSAMPQG
jgi:ERCC4-type nuclease